LGLGFDGVTGNRNQASRSCGSFVAGLGLAFDGVTTRGAVTVGAGVATARGEGVVITISLEMYAPESGNGSRGALVMPKPTPKEPCWDPPGHGELTVFATTVTVASALSLGMISTFAQPSSSFRMPEGFPAEA
jgi:hypothetical protein